MSEIGKEKKITCPNGHRGFNVEIEKYQGETWIILTCMICGATKIMTTELHINPWTATIEEEE